MMNMCNKVKDGLFNFRYNAKLPSCGLMDLTVFSADFKLITETKSIKIAEDIYNRTVECFNVRYDSSGVYVDIVCEKYNGLDDVMTYKLDNILRLYGDSIESVLNSVESVILDVCLPK